MGCQIHYNFWRPVTAIQEGETDGNPATAPDSKWISLITTPPFPDYISGHRTVQRRSRGRVVPLLWDAENSIHHSLGRIARCRSKLQRLLAGGRRGGAQPNVWWDSLQVGERGRLEIRPGNWRLDIHTYHAAEVRSLCPPQSERGEFSPFSTCSSNTRRKPQKWHSAIPMDSRLGLASPS